MRKWVKGTAKLVSTLTVMAMLVTAVGCSGTKTDSSTDGPKATGNTSTSAGKPVKLKMITWVQETNQKAIDALNASFTKANPNVTFVVDTAAANDYPTLLNTRIAAGDVDIISNLSAFDSLPQDFTKGCDKQAWQTFVEGGNYLDITDQPFVKNWDTNMIKNAVSYQGKVYGLDMGAVGYNGLFYSKKLFKDNGLKEPGTWAEFVNICKTFQGKGIAPITLGGKDAWPLNAIAVSGIVGANVPNMTEYAKGLWTGSRKFNDPESMKIWNRMDEFLSFCEKNVQAVAYGDAPGRLVAGKVAMMYDGTWNAGALTGLDPNFEFGYFPVPGDVDGKPNQLQGKYDMQFNIYAKTANKDLCLKWMTFLSQKENYGPFVSELGFFPTMPGVESSSKFVASLADKNKSFSPSWEKVFVAPKGVGQYAAGQGFVLSSLKSIGGQVDGVKALADLAQNDFETAVKNAK